MTDVGREVSDASGASPGAPAHRPAVLVCEDEELVRITSCESLEEAGFKVLEAADATEALALIETHPEIRVLVTDVKMPGWMSGIDLARLVEKKWPEISILLTSAYYTAEDGDLPENMTVFPKPFMPQELAREVRLLMKR